MVATHEYSWHLRDDGDPNRPPLLLLHGFTGCVEVWDDIAAGLAGSCRCLRVDLPGHGRARTPDEPDAFTMERVAGGLIALLDELTITRTHLWGYSMGGRLALYLAVNHAHRFDHLILESASPGISDAAGRARRRVDDDRLALEIEQSGVPAFVERWLAQPLFATQASLPASRRELARRLRLMHTADGLADSLRGMGVGAQQSLDDALPTLANPTMILVGEHDAKFHAIGAAMAAVIPGASLCVIPDCGHAPHWEQPHACIAAARAFLCAGAGQASVPASTGRVGH